MKKFSTTSISNRQLTGLISLATATFLSACGTPPGAYQPAAYVSPEPVKHAYEITVKGREGVPIEGAKVEFGNIKGSGTGNMPAVECLTAATGVCSVTVAVLKDPTFYYLEVFNSSLSFKVSKDGYYSDSGSLSSSAGRNEPSASAVKKRTSFLYRPVDYLSNDFLNSMPDKELREQALRFISVLRVQSLLNEADLTVGGIGTSSFKGKKYFQLKAEGTTTFNTLKLDKYAIGKRIFDDSIRKILNPLNDHISNQKNFYGYDLVFYGKSRDFSDKDKYIPITTEYRFLIPQDAVRRYKDKDISGQQLLDASVLLMNDERIDMKLQ